MAHNSQSLRELSASLGQILCYTLYIALRQKRKARDFALFISLGLIGTCVWRRVPTVHLDSSERTSNRHSFPSMYKYISRPLAPLLLLGRRRCDYMNNIPRWCAAYSPKIKWFASTATPLVMSRRETADWATYR